MPLEPERWKQATSAPSEFRSVLVFLRSNHELAFSDQEILDAISQSASALDRERCKVYLETLVELGKVDKRSVDGTSYYRAVGPTSEEASADAATAATDGGTRAEAGDDDIEAEITAIDDEAGTPEAE